MSFSLFTNDEEEKRFNETNTEILGEIPIEPLVSECGDEGRFFVNVYGKTPAGIEFEIGRAHV